ncbi:V-type proton ATPase subunit C isoform X2 [Drosophila busckii]|nr:V-type proton ATPase subunit C isoform X2 [Drosophila busckii]XP_017837273.1 V-type proton ATPase subunit C isoform X2 [Drosophila busckii]
MMSEYWIISAPGDKTCQQTFDTMNNLTSKQHNLCSNYKFHIPDLKVGTLDQLVGLSDDLGKLDTYVEQITRKVANYLGEVLEDQRDKLHENLMANNSPGPPDEMPCRHHQRLKHLSLRHQRKHQHTHHQNNPLSYHHHHHHHQLPTDLKGKCHHNLSNKSAAATTTATTATATTTTTMHASNASNASACASATASAYSASARPSAASAVAVASACPSCPLSGGSLTNLSSTHDESERDFDFVIPPGCACDECYSSSLFAPPSASATASTLMADECYSQTASSMLNATRCAISTVAAIATGSMSSMAGAGASTSVAAAANAAACCSSQSHATAADAAAAAAPAPAPAKTSSASTLSSSAYFSTSAPTASSSVHSMSRSNSKKLNNNTCSINNNKLSFRSSSSHVSQFNLPTPQSPQQKQPPMQLPGGGMLSPTPPLLSPTEKSTGDTDDEELEDPKSPHSASSLSETFDWWFNKPKRNSKKCSAHDLRSQLKSQTPNLAQTSTHTQTPAPTPLHTRTQTQTKPMTFWHQTSLTPRSSYRSFFNSLADQIYSKRSTTTPCQLNINNGFNLTPTHRSSPVSSCCGSSSQGRSSPDTDHAEPPEFPLSPVYCSHQNVVLLRKYHSPRLTPIPIKLKKYIKHRYTHTYTQNIYLYFALELLKHFDEVAPSVRYVKLLFAFKCLKLSLFIV